MANWSEEKYVVGKSITRTNIQRAALRLQGCTMRASQLVERLSLVESGHDQPETKDFTTRKIRPCELLALAFCSASGQRGCVELAQLRKLTSRRWPLQIHGNSPRGSAATDHQSVGPSSFVPVHSPLSTSISLSRGPGVPPNADQAAGDAS
jgi:hypothetical protein